MLIPIIKVKDRDYNSTHIVGTDSHDALFVDKESGGIHYHNLQNLESTKRIFDGVKSNDYAYEFIGVNEACSPGVEIEFVTLEALFELAMNEMDASVGGKVKLQEMLREYVSKKEKCENAITASSNSTGVRILS